MAVEPEARDPRSSPQDPIRIALDLSCAFDHPLTGVGYAALHQVRALHGLESALDLRLFAARAASAPSMLPELEGMFSHACVLPYARLLKYHLWTRLAWPPIERFCGDVDIAHGLFHDLPATRRALRVVTVHDLSPFRMPEVHTARAVAVHRRILQHAARHADAFVAVSESCCAELIDILGVSAERVHVIPNGVDLGAFQDEFDDDLHGRVSDRLGIARDYLIHVGTLEPRKNLPRLLGAYARLRDQLDACPQLVLVGKRGWLDEPVFETMERLGLGGDVIHAGYLDRQDALTLLRGARACVYPSLYEGFGLPVLEAMAARTPVLTSNVTALPEVAGEAAVYVDPSDEASILDGLHRLLNDEEGAAKRVESGYARAQAFSWVESASRLADLYRLLAG
jgi:glycosyltransferase involved in cell wall biosynthesis